MAKYKIKWRDSDITKLEQNAERFNRKLESLVSKFPDAHFFLPTPVDIEQLKSSIATRNDFNKQNKFLEGFASQEPEYIVNKRGTLSTQYYIDYLTKVNDQNNRRKAKDKAEMANQEIHLKEITIPGKNFGEPRDISFREYKFDFYDLNYNDLIRKANAIIRQQYDYNYNANVERYKENYIALVEQFLGEYAQQVIDVLLPVPAHLMYSTYTRRHPVLYIEYLYDPISQRMKSEQLVFYWSRYLGEGV